MEFPSRPLSRRALVRAAGIAPVMALGKQAWAQPHPARMLELARMSLPVPEKELEKAVGTAGASGADPAKFETVARVLWQHYLVGTGDVPTAEGVMTLAFERSEGPLVQNVKDGKFDPFGNDALTNFCAYVCGHKAATIALANKQEAIDGKTYEQARKQTEAEMKAKLSKARGGLAPLGRGC